MKKLIGILSVLILVSFLGCEQNTTQPQDLSIFEKRVPVSKNDSLKNRVPLTKALECLNLTREQRIVIDSILKEHNQCVANCKIELNESIKTLREEYKSKIEKYRGVEKTDEIKKEIEIINFEYRQTQKDLQKEYREKMAECVKILHTDIEALLRNDQLTLWNLWKVTGKIPCNFTKP